MEEQKQSNQPVSFRADNIPVLSLENEKMALKLLMTICAKTLEGYTQKYEDDMKLLEDKSLTGNARNCIILRAGEKDVSSTSNFNRYCRPMLISPIRPLTSLNTSWRSS